MSLAVTRALDAALVGGVVAAVQVHDSRFLALYEPPLLILRHGAHLLESRMARAAARRIGGRTEQRRNAAH